VAPLQVRLAGWQSLQLPVPVLQPLVQVVTSVREPSGRHRAEEFPMQVRVFGLQALQARRSPLHPWAQSVSVKPDPSPQVRKVEPAQIF
jgi:hypothetical protein